MDWHIKAQRRVDSHPELKVYEDTIMYGWSVGGHWEWVATAPSGEIIDWAQEEIKPRCETCMNCDSEGSYKVDKGWCYIRREKVQMDYVCKEYKER